MADDTTKPGDAEASKDSGSKTPAAEGGESYDDWYKAQDEKARSMIDAHVGGLKSALDTLKSERRTLKDEMKAIRESKDSDAEKQVSQIHEQFEQSERRIAFYESLPAEYYPNAKHVWVLASANGCLKRDGTLDVEKFKAECGALFQPKAAKANAGDGAGNPPNGTGSQLNEWLRTGKQGG